ncbi:MAG: hypothetical protein WBQ19_06165 [Terriglobales bacterium]
MRISAAAIALAIGAAPWWNRFMNGDNLSHFRGHAGEMYVSAELMRRGWFAAMTARGSRSFDILARRADKPQFAAIRVKTGHGSFLWNAKKDGTLFLDMTDTGDFTVIVDLPDVLAVSPCLDALDLSASC